LAGKQHWDPEPWAQYWKKRLRLDGQVQIHLRRIRSGPEAPHFWDVTQFLHTRQICQEIAVFKAAAFIGTLCVPYGIGVGAQKLRCARRVFTGEVGWAGMKVVKERGRTCLGRLPQGDGWWPRSINPLFPTRRKILPPPPNEPASRAPKGPRLSVRVATKHPQPAKARTKHLATIRQ